MDFVNNLGSDTSLAIFEYLDDPLDLLRASAVSRSWRQFVIKNSVFKNRCLKLFPQLTNVDRIIHSSGADRSSSLLEREHRAYTLLYGGCTLSPIESCIANAIMASSTDDPSEGIFNTLDERDQIASYPSYWSSIGQESDSVPESLVYKLKSDLCVINEIKIHPFQAYFQRGSPIYSSHFVRFRFGHCKNNSQDNKCETEDESNYVWDYTSQEFPMAQENRIQNFKLEEHVLCVGGYMLIEFLGRVQRQELDGLYFICITHVAAMGRSLENLFWLVNNPDDSGKFGLKVVRYSGPQAEEWQMGLRSLKQLFNHMRRLGNENDESDDED